VLRFDRKLFSEKKMVLGDNYTWHELSTCLWRSSFALANFQDLSLIYGDLESFFVRRLRVKKASPSMLIKEVGRMAEERLPQIAELRTRLVDIGMMLTKIPVDDSIAQALTSLKEVKFLPKRVSAGASTLVAVTDDFAIADHERYCAAFAEHDVLLDFQLDEVSMLHPMFQRLGISHRYLSNVVEEISTVGEDSHVDEILSQQLVAKAYALYW
jgi:hypothetical protein